MLRPHEAFQARRPFPLMEAGWAYPACRKSVPGRPASSKEIFRVIYVPTDPRVQPSWPPFAKWTPYAGDLNLVALVEQYVCEVLGLVAKPQTSGEHIVTLH